jgi:hypothetical protein
MVQADNKRRGTAVTLFKHLIGRRFLSFFLNPQFYCGFGAAAFV